MLFKITLLQTWYGLSDCEVEDQIRDRISFSHFVGISLDESDTKYLDQVLDKLDFPAGAWVMADKGYKSKYNDKIVSSKRLKNRVMHKANRENPHTDMERRINKTISKIRYRVERTFGSMVSWFGAGVARYVGIEKMHTQHLIQAIALNLYRAPGIVMSICQK